MKYPTIPRALTSKLLSVLERGKSVLLLGPRQAGKTTLISQLTLDRSISLVRPQERLRYEKDPRLFTSEIEAMKSRSKKQPLVFVDEIQKIPLLMDAVQDLIDRDQAQFILTGSSARKLKKGEMINLLPGRIIPLRLDPLIELELTSVNVSLKTLLLDGSLPEIILTENDQEREELLEAYVTIYLEEEVRAEALVRHLGHFARFLELAASESGSIVNFSKLSQEIGVPHTTIRAYYQILEDCLIIERIEPMTRSKTRRKLSKAQKYLFYDLGVRRIAAHEGRRLSKKQMGHLFEQFIGLEILRSIRLSSKRIFLKYWRDPTGPEIDWLIETTDNHLIPIKVKWTDAPTVADAKHLLTFLKEYPEAPQGFIICQTPHPMKITDHIEALPWNHLHNLYPS